MKCRTACALRPCSCGNTNCLFKVRDMYKCEVLLAPPVYDEQGTKVLACPLSAIRQLKFCGAIRRPLESLRPRTAYIASAKWLLYLFTYMPRRARRSGGAKSAPFHKGELEPPRVKLLAVNLALCCSLRLWTMGHFGDNRGGGGTVFVYERP